MNTQLDHGPVQTTATIIQFPAGGRAGLDAHRRSDSVLDKAMEPNPNVMYGSWYHEEAIAEATRPHKV